MGGNSKNPNSNIILICKYPFHICLHSTINTPAQKIILYSRSSSSLPLRQIGTNLPSQVPQASNQPITSLPALACAAPVNISCFPLHQKPVIEHHPTSAKPSKPSINNTIAVKTLNNTWLRLWLYLYDKRIWITLFDWCLSNIFFLQFFTSIDLTSLEI